MNCNCDTGEIQKDIYFHYWLTVFWIISVIVHLSINDWQTQDKIDHLIKMHQTTTTAQAKVGG